MKDKRLTYILVPLVIIIWGTVFWKFYSGLRKTANNTIIPSLHISDETVNDIPDTIRLSFQYNDPFLHNQIGKSGKPAKPESETRAPIIVVPWPRVEYKGAVVKHNSEKFLGLIIISGKQSLISEGDVFENIRVIKITPDSIKLEYMNDSRFFSRTGL